MHALALTTVFIWIISLASILCMLLRPRGIAEVYWVAGGAVLLLLTRLISVSRAVAAVHKGLDVYLFLIGMMLLAELARHEGVFDWVADVAVRKAKNSAARLFFFIYAAGVAVTALLSNDATAVVLTPAVLAAVRRARVEPRPYLLACALIANAASFVLPISNPANLVIYGQKLPALRPWLGYYLAPSIASIGITYLCLWLISRKSLRGTLAQQESHIILDTSGKLALAGLGLAAAALLTASAFGVPLGAPTCIAAAVAVLVVTLRDRRALAAVLKGVSWSVIALVAALFTIVEALNQAGLLDLARKSLHWLDHASPATALFGSAFGLALLSNGMNNLPVGLAAGAALTAHPAAAWLSHAVLLGVDLGPNLSVTGSLATILWLIALRRENAEITAWGFLKVGLIVMPAALAVSVLMLLFVR